MKYRIKYCTVKLRESPEAITTPEIIDKLFRDEKNDYQEGFWVLGLNVKNKVILKNLVAKGGYNTVNVTPKDILTPLLHNLCSNFIVVHNHPSGDISFSEEDLRTTRKIKDAAKIIGLNLLDHIVISPAGFKSMKKEGII